MIQKTCLKAVLAISIIVLAYVSASIIDGGNMTLGMCAAGVAVLLSVIAFFDQE